MRHGEGRGKKTLVKVKKIVVKVLGESIYGNAFINESG